MVDSAGDEGESILYIVHIYVFVHWLKKIYSTALVLLTMSKSRQAGSAATNHLIN